MRLSSTVFRPLLLAAALLSPMVGTTATAAELTQQEKDLAINGPYYKKLVQMKDVVADILPPPAYIIESELTVLVLIDLTEQAMEDGKLDPAETKAIDDLIEYGRQLKDGAPKVFPGYVERIELWKTALSDATPDEKLIKKLLTVKSAEFAMKFFDVRDSKLNPLIKAGDVKGAKAVAHNELKPLYLEHRAAIDAVVTRARRLTEKIEAEVTEKLSGKSVVAAEVLIKSPLYTKVILMKDLVADILPPPAYIIESYLTVLQQIDETEVALASGGINAEAKTALEVLIEYGRQLKEGDSSKGEMAGYKERIAAWTTDLASDTPEAARIKELMITLSYAPAMKFYEVRDAKFIPLINKAAVAEAKKLVRQELLPLYAEHRKHIDALVIASNALYDQIQAKVDALLAGGK
jgi:F0F1-type ATP synthase delta subunit